MTTKKEREAQRKNSLNETFASKRSCWKNRMESEVKLEERKKERLRKKD